VVLEVVGDHPGDQCREWLTPALLVLIEVGMPLEYPAVVAEIGRPYVDVIARRQRMNSISAYFGSGQRSSGTIFSSLSAASRTLAIAAICLSRA
jgi:hypothetical protein